MQLSFVPKRKLRKEKGRAGFVSAPPVASTRSEVLYAETNNAREKLPWRGAANPTFSQNLRFCGNEEDCVAIVDRGIEDDRKISSLRSRSEQSSVTSDQSVCRVSWPRVAVATRLRDPMSSRGLLPCFEETTVARDGSSQSYFLTFLRSYFQSALRFYESTILRFVSPVK